MAQAMADGMLASGIVKGEQLYACARQWDKLCRNTEVRGMHACKHAIDMVRQCDIILLAVKPAQMSEAISTVKEHLQGKAVVSIAAGMFFETYEQLLPPHTQHLSVIPNMPVSVCEGVMLWEQRNSLQTEEAVAVEQLFSAIAFIEKLESDQMTIGATVAGCGPAFAAMFIEALGDGGCLPALCADDGWHCKAATGSSTASGTAEGSRKLSEGNDDSGSCRAGASWFSQCPDFCNRTD